MKSEKEILEQFKKHLKESRAGLSRQYANTRKCQAFYAGDIMNYTDKISVGGVDGKQKKVLVQFNKVKPYVNAVAGFFIQNRRKVRYQSRTSSALSAFQSDYVNAFAEYCRKRAFADQQESRQEKDLFINGYGCIETALSYDEGMAGTDPNGQIVSGRLDPRKVGWDASAREPNLIDRRFDWYVKEYDLKEALALFDGAQEADFEKGEGDESSGEYEYNPRGGGIKSMIRERYDYADREQEVVNVYFYQWYEIEPFWRVDNPARRIDPLLAQDALLILESFAQENDGDGLFVFDPRSKILDCDADLKRKIEDAFGEAVDLEFVEYKRKVFYQAVISGDKVFTHFKSLYQNGFTRQFKTGDFDEVNRIWTGMVNSMMDPSLYYNKALTELMYIIAVSAKGGLLYEKGAIENIRQFEATYAKSDKNSEVAKNALAEGRIQPKREQVNTAGLDGIIAIADGAFPEVNGIDRSFLGSSDSAQETAILQRQRVKQVLNTLATYADSITLFQELSARLFLSYMREIAETASEVYFPMQGQDEKKEMVPLVPDHLRAEYDVETLEAPDSATERQEKVAILTSMAKDLLAIGDPAGKVLYGIALRHMNLESEDRAQAMEALIPKDASIDPAHVKQLEEALAAAKSEQNTVQLRKIVSETMKNMAQVEEVQARSEKTTATTVETLEKAKRLAKETDLIAQTESVRVVI